MAGASGLPHDCRKKYCSGRDKSCRKEGRSEGKDEGYEWVVRPSDGGGDGRAGLLMCLFEVMLCTCIGVVGVVLQASDTTLVAL